MRNVSHKQTPSGKLLLLVADPQTAEMDTFLYALPRAERVQIYSQFVFDSDESISYL